MTKDINPASAHLVNHIHHRTALKHRTSSNSSNNQPTSPDSHLSTIKMHITVVPASPKVGQATIRALLADASKPTVKGYYRNLSKVPAEFKSNPRFEAVQGDVEDGATLSFAGSDAVFNITPPVFEDQDFVAHARRVSENVKAAVKKAESVKRLVLLSSFGGQYDHGTVRLIFSDLLYLITYRAREVLTRRCRA